VENATSRPDLAAEHGLAVWLEIGDARVLFDTGQSGVVCENARRLGIDLSEADAVVLSHGHYDHVGGLGAVVELAPEATVYVHPDAGVRPRVRNLVVSCVSEAVAPGVRTTGEIERVTDFETRREKPVPFPDDQALFFEVEGGLVVVVGCAHAGVVNTLRHVAKGARCGRIHTVFGGMHLGGASGERIRKTVDAFRELGVERIGPCHCTGAAATAALKAAFPGACVACPVGTVLTFGQGND